jgi:2-oxoglutarate dehydrogenase E2 component (dihydrolipoamide succinyltransferase)
MIRDHQLDTATLPATGPGNRITKTDVLQALEAKATPQTLPAGSSVLTNPPRTTTPREERKPMTPLRRTIASRLLESQNTTATLTTFNEIDMSAAQDLRSKYNEKFEKKYGVKLGFSSIFTKAVIEALKAYPIINARIEGNEIVYNHFYDIGMAVSTDAGLVVPVIRDADQLSFAEIEKAIADMAKRARERKLGVADIQGGTFSITNGGVFGSMMSTPILNPPQSAILGLHAIQKRPTAVNDQVVIRPMMYVALSYDHRLIDGRDAVQFLVRVKECVENPERMLFGI